MGWQWIISLILCLFPALEPAAPPSRRHFLSPDAEDPLSIASRQYRTAFHFQPAQNWINDPNGPMVYNGIYHLFYQYNPYSAEWGNLTWGHSISTDLINWTPLDIALRPSEPFDRHGCWSGSATILPANGPVILYTGINESGHNVQNIAFPKNISDLFLIEWVKPPYNPVIVAEGVNATQFRDPSSCWMGKDGLWRTTVGAEDFDGKAKVLLYKSKGFLNWTKAEKPLFSADSLSMIECVDFFPVCAEDDEKGSIATPSVGSGVKHVLKMGVFDYLHDYYLIGRYLEELDGFMPENVVANNHRVWPRYDYGSFYASKTFLDNEKRRRVLWAWSNESDTVSDDIVKGWAGVQTVPRTIWLAKNGKQLLQWPVKELESLRRNKVELRDVEAIKGGLIEIKALKAAQADIEVEFKFPELERAEFMRQDWKLDDAQIACGQMGASVSGSIGPFGLLVLASPDLEEHTAIFFRVFKSSRSHYYVLMCSDQRKSSLWPELYKPVFGGFVAMDVKEEETLSLRTLIDHSVVESFGAGGRTCITARVYPKLLLTGDSHIYVFNNGSETVKIRKVRVWEMEKARIN